MCCIDCLVGLKLDLRLGFLGVCFASSAPIERHARPRSASRAGCGGHPVPMALVSWITAYAGMTRCHKNWQCIYEMDIWWTRAGASVYAPTRAWLWSRGHSLARTFCKSALL